MTPEQLRQNVLNGIDRLLKIPFVGHNNIVLLEAQKKFWTETDLATIELLLQYYNEVNV